MVLQRTDRRAEEPKRAWARPTVILSQSARARTNKTTPSDFDTHSVAGGALSSKSAGSVS
jgi:hypothetical protein